VFPPIPAEPDIFDAWGAIKFLDELIGEFPFTSAEARSVALAALLTGVIRRSLPTAPGLGFTAPIAGTGKGLLCNTIGLVASGRKPSPITQAGEEETEKRLSGLLMRGDTVISIDNITEPLGGNKLLSVLTEELVGLRPLGGSQIVNHLTNALFLFNGNNLSLLGDMCRRVLMCGMDPACEHPERREFGFSPADRVRQDRGRYVCACLTILRAYLAAGSPAQAPPLGSYVEWSRLVRDALIWAGQKDPCLTIDSTKASDPVAERVGAVFHHWAQVIGEGVRITVKDAVAAAQSAGVNGQQGLIDAFQAVAAPMARGSAYERVDPRRLGEWIKRHKDRIVGGWRVVLSSEVRDGNRQWYLEAVGGSR
jgi:putative DNA primase/helicase